MNIRINGQEYACHGLQVRGNDTQWGGRESRAITLPMTYAEALSLFKDDVPWAVVFEGVDEDGTAYTSEKDMSEYALSGPITDNRDGTVTVKMGKHHPDELLETALHTVPGSHLEAEKLRGIIETAVQSIEDDATALAAAALYPDWAALVTQGSEVEAGFRFRSAGKLYRVMTAHTLQADWVPGVGTESLYTCIDEAHSGTAADPIPYEGNMALVCDLYYSQGGVVYLCTRDTVNPVYHALADLVGLYVEVVA